MAALARPQGIQHDLKIKWPLPKVSQQLPLVVVVYPLR